MRTFKMYENMQMQQEHKIYDQTKHVELMSYLNLYLIFKEVFDFS